MDSGDEIGPRLARLRQASPAGFAIALHVNFTAPKYLFQAYDRVWLDEYSRRGLVLHDPTVAWAFANTGTIRWSDLPRATGGPDVLALAGAHGLTYGVTVALTDAGGSRSMASFARADREFTDAEIAAIADDLAALHDATGATEKLHPDLHGRLRQMSVMLTHG